MVSYILLAVWFAMNYTLAIAMNTPASFSDVYSITEDNHIIC